MSMKPLFDKEVMQSPFHFLSTIKVFVLGMVIGASFVALVLDSRGQAMFKAFMNPTVVNGLEISVDIKK